MAGERRSGRDETTQSRADRFWEAFRFTENGKPKSSLGVYSFSLSILYIIVYVLCFEGAIRFLTKPLADWPVLLQNAVISLLASGAGTALCCLPHRFFMEKRLVFRSYLCLAGYAAVVLIAMLIMTAGSGTTAALLRVFGWFIAIPVAMGTLVSWRLASHSMRAEAHLTEAEPEWKKYVDRR